jgi:glycogen operon protein
VLGRTRHGFDPHAAFFTALKQDPVLNRVHLIAEPWDTGPDGYQVGRFPGRWQEWNDKLRDSVRRYWLGRSNGHGVSRGEFARRFTASSDLFHHGQRRPTASVNFIAVHDGFTLLDLVSYSHKHNLANGEDNRDGRSDEPCTSFGVEGPTADAGIVALRQRVRRALLATLMLAQGTPMLCAGDEIGKSQGGNNNAYCQDNPSTWLDWAGADTGLAAYVGRLAALRRAEPALRHDRWFQSRSSGPDERSLSWFAPSGHEMQVNDWHDAQQQALACRINGEPPARPGHHALLLAFNPEALALPFTLPPPGAAGTWELLLDSSDDLAAGLRSRSRSGEVLRVPPQAVIVLRQVVA